MSEIPRESESSELDRQIDDLEYAGKDSDYIELYKLRISFWEKLILLDASVFALSFTAAAFFRAHPVGDGGVGYLVLAWRLLIMSIISAGCAEWFSYISVTQLSHYRTAGTLSRKLGIVLTSLASIPTGTMKDLTAKKRSLDSIAKRGSKAHSVCEWLAGICGFAAQIATVAAFIYLYKYARVNTSLGLI